ncbi:MAG: DUF1579 family protein [Armatimonadetes bacterium]|nr:DUF1579 family protein [Armatimonadota bacterium]
MRKLGLFFVGLATMALAAPRQEGMMPPPKELAALNYMLGSFTGKMDFYMGGPNPTKSKGSVRTAKTMGGMWVEGHHTYDMGGMKMDGRQLLSYDPAKKQYVGYWFDQAAPGAMELSGNIAGGKLVLISKPTPVPGMQGDQVFRATYSKKGAKSYDFRLEMKSGDKWDPMIVGVYTKK